MGDNDPFTALMGELDYPMFIISTQADGERSGCLIGFATQISIHPPRFLVGLSHENHTWRVAQHADLLGVHFVPAEDTGIAELFGGQTGDEVDKFARCAWHEGPGGVPIVDSCPNWFVGRIVERIDAGDHDALVLEPIAARHAARESELTFHQARAIHPGHPA
jgi:flavin reductase (DIM6/NTAB) family NADH-FMN oxidoreductase RutF